MKSILQKLNILRLAAVVVSWSFLQTNVIASKLHEIQALDRNCIILHFQDGYVEYLWDDTLSGSCNGWDYYHTEDWSLCNEKDIYHPYGDALNTVLASKHTSYFLSSLDDSNYVGSPASPTAVFRKSKVWEASFNANKPAMHHWISLMLPSPLQRGKTYNLTILEGTGSDRSDYTFVYDEKEMESPAIKIANTGYESSAPHKFADVYFWTGDGGAYNFSDHNENNFYLYNTLTGEKEFNGVFKFRMKKRKEPLYKRDFTGSDVWECDFSAFTGKGTYRLVIDGVGCSREFEIGSNRFEELFKVSMQGMFYQRMGCEAKPTGNYPYSRRPLYKQGVEPEGFEVKISNKNMVEGENPDNRSYYSSSLSGETATATWGGWSDAYDNDQRPVNFICVFDILLTYYLYPEAFTDNQLYVPETGNGIPDIIDEALWEIDWWLRMRDSQGGYLTGLTNILPPAKVNYAGAPCAWQGWCVAAGCAMVADCFRLSGNDTLKNHYQQEAIKAFKWAEEHDNQMLDVEASNLRGRDLKMTAAAYLYNLTGEEWYEDIVKQESEVSNTQSQVRALGKWEQQYATVGYIFSPRPINYPGLKQNMKESIIDQAKKEHLKQMDISPTKAARWTSGWEGQFQTSNEMTLVAIAHKISVDNDEKYEFERGLYAEAEWTLGRNPLGLAQMTGLGKAGITQSFAPGRRDGYPGLTPGWTPYMCRDGWNNGNNIVRCEWYTNHNYPKNKENWPYGEHYWNSRYNVPNGEATPQQTFRQKILLYGYLYAANHYRNMAERVGLNDINFKTNSKTLYQNEQFTIEVNFNPAIATSKTLQWSSENTNIATVGGYGIVNAILPGNTKISATTIDGKYSEECIIIVLESLLNSNNKVADKVSVFPNPVNHVLNMYSKDDLTIKEIKVLDRKGKTIIKKPFSSNSVSLKTDELKQGIYILIIETNNKTLKQKIIVI